MDGLRQVLRGKVGINERNLERRVAEKLPDAVEGWLVPDGELYLELEGSAYAGFLVRHTALVQLGVPVEP